MNRTIAAITLAVFAALPATLPAAQTAPNVADAVTDEVWAAAYNLDYERALILARQDVTAHPDDSARHRVLATIVWMDILFARGGITIDHYLGGLTSSRIPLPPPSERAANEFKDQLTRAIDLGEAAVKRDSRDVDARYDLGAAYGLQASYTATVDGDVGKAMGAARRAYRAHQWVLDHAPERRDAGLVVGTYRYAVASLSLPKRLLAYLAGFGGGKERGLGLVEGAVEDPGTRTAARLALALMYSREDRQADALAVLKALFAEHPRNRLLQMEIGSAAWRAGEAEEAELAFSEGLAWHDRDPRPKIPGERAMWLYKRGMARVSLNHLDAAIGDLRLALDESPVGWVRGRVHLELGKVADLRLDRSGALAEYLTAAELCRTHRDPWCREEAARWKRNPYEFRPKK